VPAPRSHAAAAGRHQPGHGKVIQAAGTEPDRLREPDNELGLGQPPRPPLQRDTVLHRLGQPHRSGRLPQRLGTAIGHQRQVVIVSTRTLTSEVASSLGSCTFDKRSFPSQEAFFVDTRTPRSAPYQGF
jgi:hypothetical protein